MSCSHTNISSVRIARTSKSIHIIRNQRHRGKTFQIESTARALNVQRFGSNTRYRSINGLQYNVKIAIKLHTLHAV